MFVWFADTKGWTPDVVAELTLDQLTMFISEGEPDTQPIEWQDPELFKARLRAELTDLPKPAEPLKKKKKGK